MSKHTPRPSWHVSDKGFPPSIWFGDELICTVAFASGKTEEIARLIAAAPKLLEHITLAADVVDELKNMSPELAEAAINMLVPVLRNTIAKAEGSDHAPR